MLAYSSQRPKTIVRLPVVGESAQMTFDLAYLVTLTCPLSAIHLAPDFVVAILFVLALFLIGHDNFLPSAILVR